MPDKISTLSDYMTRIASCLRRAGRVRTAETYNAAARSFRRFLNDSSHLSEHVDDIPLNSITPDVMLCYETWLIAKGVVANTSSFYMRVIRAAYNRAVEEGLTPDLRPFRRVYTGIGKTRKRAIPIEDIRTIRHLDLKRYPAMDYARDMFLMSFLLRGMSFVDMAFLKKNDLRKGYIRYRRRKTGQTLRIGWTAEMQAILDKYPRNQSPYLLPIINREDINSLYKYRSVACVINRNLKKIACLAGIQTSLSLYVARHSWASAAQSKGIPLNIISEGMGHDSERTTRIYLASLDTSCVDMANSIIIASI